METKGRASYRDGFKYCSRCGLWFKVDGARCPKCGMVMRASGRKKGGDKPRVDPSTRLREPNPESLYR